MAAQRVGQIGVIPNVRVFSDLQALSVAAAAAVVDVALTAASARGRCALVPSGGRTSRTLYERLASRWRDRIPWQALHLFGVFLVAGSKKAHVLSPVLSPTADPNVYPAAAVRPEAGAVTWWVDQAAAREVSS